MMGSIVAELLPVRPYPLDMSTWTVRGHGRILTRMLAEIPGLRLDLAPDAARDRRASSTSSCRPSPTRRVRTLTAPVRAIRQARRFDTRDWTRDPRFAGFEREVTRAARARSRARWRGASWSAVPDRVLASLDGLITLRVDYLPHAGVSLLEAPAAARACSACSARRVRSREASAPARADANAGLAQLAASRSRRDRSGLAAFRASDAGRLRAPGPSRRRASPDFATPVAAYLAEYGHREVRSAFLMSEPTWGEVPALLYAGIAAFLDRPRTSAAETGRRHRRGRGGAAARADGASG